MRIGIIGPGLLGREFYKQSQEEGWELDFAASRTGIYKDIDKREGHGNQDLNAYSPDLVALTIPTFDDGRMAFKYTLSFVSRGIPVVTAEKGSLANFREELDPHLQKIGYTATVGGGSRLLRHLRKRSPQNVKRIDAILNGTLNYIMHGLAQKRSLNELAHECKENGYAEPGSEDTLSILNQESVGDIPMKTAILGNDSSLFPTTLRAKDFTPKKITTTDLERLREEADQRRFIVSIARLGDNHEDRIAGFEYIAEGWRISAGFVPLNKKERGEFLDISGISNALMIVGADNCMFYVAGDGAGAKRTVETMVSDARGLLSL
ncbi:MAG: hypothetical protein Q8Q31_04330 [Nanoarchaeota archaeon]|nr:hypothetical protein [Nanoarchaeota archaeon]